MDNELLQDIPHQVLETLEAGTVREPKNDDVDVHSSGFNVNGILSFTGSCMINLILPFFNGLMLGFGELLAHEICWRKNIFNRLTNKGYRVYPQTRITRERERNSSAGKFL
ncbi:hypothetical protein HG535_0D04270 [Zygotorulaspora mrakii]|uniref:Mitochondrial import protein 1 n=1 Tax=Zygotorulaspora mrakii TaxID=42260 RepID=A0A7H9B444_ZYGMR|nr:uncharacterized protein HG535_0D04270 [Zygotorulaspora mrakii]QLG72719.1 hypothetical protein HG535_0D04270 [Zygotorulaspora mrakii]